MKYLIAILLPPLAVLMCGKPIQCLLNIVLTFLFWIPGVIHALFVVSGFEADQRNKKVVKAIKQQTNALKKAEKAAEKAARQVPPG